MNTKHVDPEFTPVAREQIAALMSRATTFEQDRLQAAVVEQTNQLHLELHRLEQRLEALRADLLDSKRYPGLSIGTLLGRMHPERLGQTLVLRARLFHQVLDLVVHEFSSCRDERGCHRASSSDADAGTSATGHDMRSHRQARVSSWRRRLSARVAARLGAAATRAQVVVRYTR